MNARARDLVDTLRDTLGRVPGATAISFHAFTAWTYVLIGASTDAAVRALGQELGLGAPEIRAARTTWWLRAMSGPENYEVRVEVAGPHHPGPPPAR